MIRLLTCIMLLVFCLRAEAIILYSGADPAANKVAPTGVLSDSGWQYEGLWGSFLGTPIASQYFITAKHVGGSVGQVFTFNSIPYTTVEMHTSSTSDLTIWKISGTFATFASLYTNKNSEVGKDLVVIGRGTERGAAVNVSGLGERGWLWGRSQGTQRWGENTVAGIVEGGTGLGNLLQADFNAGLGPGNRGNEAQLSVGDSSGGVFIKDGGTWKLAGINYSVSGYYNLTNTKGAEFNASIYDARGLYLGNDTDGYTYIDPRLPTPAASSFYATQISDNVTWIDSVIPEPSVSALVVFSLFAMLVVRRTVRRGLPTKNGQGGFAGAAEIFCGPDRLLQAYQTLGDNRTLPR